MTQSNQTIISKTTLPALKDKVAASNPSLVTLDLLLQRRSLLAKDITEPGPDKEQIQQLLQIGARVPDHGVLSPWRFLIFQGQARHDIGEILVEEFLKTNPEANPEQIDFERQRFSRVPLVIAVISSINPEVRIPEWEQFLSAGAVCQNILIAANAMGFASQWLTEWYAYDAVVTHKIGLAENEKIAGFIFLGTAGKEASERRRPVLDERIGFWTKSA